MVHSFNRSALFIAVSLLALSLPSLAEARYGQQGMFGGRDAPDGSVDLRNPVAPVEGANAGQSVAERPRPAFDAVPVDVGSFQMYPSLELGSVFDSNIYSERNTHTSDLIWSVKPALSFFSNWSRHALAIGGQGDIGFYTDRSQENFYDGIANIRGRFDVTRRTFLNYGADYQRLTEARGSPNNNATAEPTDFNYYSLFTGFERGQGKFKLSNEYKFRYFDYNSTRNNAGKVNLNNRDRSIHQLTSELRYDLMRFWQPFVRGGYNWRDYDANSQRTSQGYDVVLGTGYELSGGIITGEIFAGWMSQDFRNWNADNQAKATSTYKFGGDLLWNVTNLTSIEMEAARTVEDTVLSGYRSFVTSGGQVTVTHELMRNVILEVNAGLTRNDFNGPVERVDDTYDAGLGSRYYFNRNFYADALYGYVNRVSDVGSANYDKHVVQFRVGTNM